MGASGYNSFGVLLATSWPAFCPRLHRLQGDFSSMITLILLQRAFCATAEVVWADNKYHNHTLYDWIATESEGNWRLEVVRRPAESKGFVLLPKRWVVERTFAWLGRCRRNSKDYERRTDSSESMLRVSALHLMLKRLKPSKVYPPFRYRVAA